MVVMGHVIRFSAWDNRGTLLLAKEWPSGPVGSRQWGAPATHWPEVSHWDHYDARAGELILQWPGAGRPDGTGSISALHSAVA